jgi:ABC-2 type transport system permease protein
MRAYFVSPLAYVMYVLFLVVCGVFFNMYFSAYYKYSQEYMTMMSMRQQFGGMPPLPNYTEMVLLGITNVMTFILLFIIPMLSMRLFAEEKKMGTIELLFTYPVKDIEVLLGKFFAAASVYAGMLALTMVYTILSYNAVPDQTYFPAVFASYLGVFLVGIAFLSFGIFASSITENQIVAGLVSFAVLLVLWMIAFVDEIQPGKLGEICNEISVFAHFEDFSKGVIVTGHVAYYILFSLFFLFLTLRVLESNKWRA